jgi:protein ImuB
LLDTHRPGAFRMVRFGAARKTGGETGRTVLGFRVFRPPRPARVRLTAGRPVHVEAERIRGEVVAWAGPWRTSGDWWRADPWARDEWDVALGDGAVYRMYSERHCWFVEGSYD